jgi:phosphoribosylanthranilate isomerase
MLEHYSGQIPFFLSGGIGPNSIFDIKSLNFPALKGIDLNSCFETRPGFKSLSLLKSFLNELRS